MVSVSILLHYQELALKGKNRPWFHRHLIQHLRKALAGLSVREVRAPMGRLELVLGEGTSVDQVRERLGYVFGLANFSVATRVAPEYDAIEAGVLRDLPVTSPDSFRVKVRRADKRFPVRSPEVERALGARIAEARGWRVDLSDPALTVGVEIVPGEAFYYFGRQPGAGGLPSRTGGRLVALLSGGIDSPVAAWRMMRRGCVVTFVHFHSYPFLSRASQDKARQLVEHLCRFQLRARLMLVPFGEIQRQVTLSVPSGLRVIVYRRLMLRIAERAAVRTRSLGLGGDLGLVRGSGAAAGVPAARRHGQGRDHHPGRAARHLRDLDSAGRRLLHAVHASASRDPGPVRRASGRRTRSPDRGVRRERLTGGGGRALHLAGEA
jgi:tRNA uracil 4-sulfurtransferase